MSTTTVSAVTVSVSADHATPIPVDPAGIYVKVLAGDTIYYSSLPSVSSGTHDGTIANGDYGLFSVSPLWVRSASNSDLGLTVGNVTSAVVLGVDGTIGGAGGTPLSADVPSLSNADGNEFVGDLITDGNLDGAGLELVEGSDAKQGTATLNGTTAVVVSNASVTATSRIFVTINSPAGTVGSPYVSARSAWTSFSIKSTNASDTSTVAYLISEVAS